MTRPSTYLLDSDVLIAAKNTYYAFEICPGFWKGLLREYERGEICSIDPVRTELLSGRPDEDLVQWVRESVPAAFFQACSSEEVVNAYTEIMLWA